MVTKSSIGAVTERYDIVLFGATGFTGGLTAEYLAGRVPAGTRWALAGRDHGRLAAVRDRLAADAPHRTSADPPELLLADADDPESLRRAAESTRVMVTTVGPFARYGDGLIAACAAAGTDYLDLTGEPEFVDRSYLRHHATARRTGARLIHCCGFDSIPFDLGVHFTVRQLPEGVPLRVESFLRASAAISAGTYHSMVNAVSRLREGAALSRERIAAERAERAASIRRAGDPGTAGQLSAAADGRRVRSLRVMPRYDRRVGSWALPAPTIDQQIVLRSARALPDYGPDFSFAHHLAPRRLPSALAIAGGAAGLFAVTQLPPARDWLLGRMASGEGPSPERRERSWFKVLFHGEGGGRGVVTEVSGGDPGYGETAKMLGEAALCAAFDELPPAAGQLTTATAMGDALTARLRAAGITFRVLRREG